MLTHPQLQNHPYNLTSLPTNPLPPPAINQGSGDRTSGLRLNCSKCTGAGLWATD